MSPVKSAVLALGSNVGHREENLRSAFRDIDSIPGIHVTRVSPIYETPALTLRGVDHSAPPYLNAVVLVATTLRPHALLEAVNGIENAHGRERHERWGSRTLDIDVIDFGGLVLNDETLTLPHPRASERGFVLAPWFAVDPDAELVGHGRVAELLAATTDTVTPFTSGEST